MPVVPRPSGATGPLLVTGATGSLGRPLVAALRTAGRAVRPASPRPDDADGVRFDFRRPTTWPAAFDGVTSMFLLRPPDISRVGRDLMPAVAYGQSVGLRHVVLLSVQGAGLIPVLPHAAVERWLRRSGLSWTFIRPSYFDQNLSGVFAPDIRARDEIVVPAGTSRTAFVDAYDVAAVAAQALLRPSQHTGRVLTPTGPLLTFGDVASLLSDELGRTISYRPVGPVAFVRHVRGVLGLPTSMAAISTVLHLSARVGLAAFETTDVQTVTGRAPGSFATFAHRERAVWLPRPSAVPVGTAGQDLRPLSDHDVDSRLGA